MISFIIIDFDYYASNCICSIADDADDFIDNNHDDECDDDNDTLNNDGCNDDGDEDFDDNDDDHHQR